ncbi:MAG: hypothetical protein ACPHY8_07085 [Patescibacteria group bacterium]
MRVTADHSGKTFYIFDQENREHIQAKFSKSLPKELSKFIVV